MVKIVVKDDPRTSANPDPLIDIGGASVASTRASLVRKQERIAVNLEMTHTDRRTILAMTVNATRVISGVVTHDHTAAIVAISDGAPVESAVLDVRVREPGGVFHAQGVGGSP